jgi:1-acyl-sn-glycerol-3-phosphate acyltransferase
VGVLGSVIFTTLLFVSVPPYALLVLFARLFGRRAAYVTAKAWCAGMVFLVRIFCGLRYQLEGQENLPAEPCVVLIKHSSAYETFVQFLILPRQSWVLKRELMWVPFLGWALATMKPIAINRNAGGSAVEQVIEQGKARLAEGLWVNIFPEGTRLPMGETRRYGMSGTLLAQRDNKLILPIAHNAGDFWPRRGLHKRPGTVRFVMGPVVDPAGRNVREVNAEIQTWMENTVAVLRATPDS